eukprot:jgi/Chlat1/2654/Chrsp178S02508
MEEGHTSTETLHVVLRQQGFVLLDARARQDAQEASTASETTSTTGTTDADSATTTNATGAQTPSLPRLRSEATLVKDRKDKDEDPLLQADDKDNDPRGKTPAASLPDKVSAPTVAQQQGTADQSMKGSKKADEDDDDDADSVKASKDVTRLRAFLQWAEVGILIALVALVVVACTVNKFRRRRFLDTPLPHWAALLLSVASGRVLSSWTVQLSVRIVETQFMLHKQAVYYAYALRAPVRMLLWAVFVLTVWLILFDTQVNSKLGFIKRVLICLVVAQGLFTLKVLAVKSLASKFHVKNYFERIQESLFHQYVLESLSAARRPKPARLRTTSHHSKHNSSTSLNLDDASSNGSPAITPLHNADMPMSIDKLDTYTSETVSIFKMKKMIKFVRNHKIKTYCSVLRSEEGADAQAAEISNSRDAKVVAKKIFSNMIRPGESGIKREDVVRLLGQKRGEKAFSLFELGSEGTVTKEALKLWVLKVYQARKSLALSLRDTKSVVAQLHNVLNFAVFLVLLIVCPFIMGVAVSALLVALSSWVLLFVFIFGNSAKATYECLVFLFSVHPFDVGDRCIIDNIHMFVDEIRLQSTVFLKSDGEKVYYPNAALLLKPISNLNRSAHQWDEATFTIDAHTRPEALEALHAKVAEYLAANPVWFYPTAKLNIRDIGDNQRMIIAINWQHKINFQNMGDRWSRRTQLIILAKKEMDRVGIDIYQQVQQMTLRTSEPLLVSTTTTAGSNF